MLGALRELWELGTAEAKREAAAIAKDAAPYIHPRLASIDQTINESYRCVIRAPEPLTNEDWEAKYGRANIGADDCLSTDIGSRTLLPKPRAEDV
jgi:hypothetical protein